MNALLVLCENDYHKDWMGRSHIIQLVVGDMVFENVTTEFAAGVMKHFGVGKKGVSCLRELCYDCGGKPTVREEVEEGVLLLLADLGYSESQLRQSRIQHKIRQHVSAITGVLSEWEEEDE